MNNNKMNELQSRIELYDNAQELVGSFDGHLGKNAVRVNDDREALKKKREDGVLDIKKTAKDSLFFGELFRALMSKKSHYKTYMNDLFIGKKSDMYIPESVSCIVKRSQNNSDCQLEAIGSRLANLFAVDTVYNLAVESDEQSEYDDYPTYDAIVSVDCIPYGYRMQTFKDLQLWFNEDSSLEEVVHTIDKKFDAIAKKNGLGYAPEKLTELKKKFAYQFMFRNLVCEDYDFCDKNTAVLIGDDGDFSLAPCFDMELLFRGRKSHVYYASFANKTIDFMMKNMPDVLTSFMDRYREIAFSFELEQVVRRAVKVDPRYTNDICNHVFMNYKRLEQMVAEYNPDQELADE
jgi:hypothetical protein